MGKHQSFGKLQCNESYSGHYEAPEMLCK